MNRTTRYIAYATMIMVACIAANQIAYGFDLQPTADLFERNGPFVLACTTASILTTLLAWWMWTIRHPRMAPRLPSVDDQLSDDTYRTDLRSARGLSDRIMRRHDDDHLRDMLHRAELTRMEWELQLRIATGTTMVMRDDAERSALQRVKTKCALHVRVSRARSERIAATIAARHPTIEDPA